MTKRRKLLNLKRFLVHAVRSDLLPLANKLCPSGSGFLRMSRFAQRSRQCAISPVSECDGSTSSTNAKVLRAYSALLFEIGAPHHPKAGLSLPHGSRKRQHAELIRTVGRHEQMLKEKGCRGGIGINYGPIGGI
jgi:hypothetical protein